jgi:hypothetical protein
MGLNGLLDDCREGRVWPDSVQVVGGKLSMRLPTRFGCGSSTVCVPAGHRAGVWLQRGLPRSQQQCPPGDHIGSLRKAKAHGEGVHRG